MYRPPDKAVARVAYPPPALTSIPVPASQLFIKFSPHALKRYRERVDSSSTAGSELLCIRTRQRDHSYWTPKRPTWLSPVEDEDDALRTTGGYLVLPCGGQICAFPLEQRGKSLRATTCLTSRYMDYGIGQYRIRPWAVSPCIATGLPAHVCEIPVRFPPSEQAERLERYRRNQRILERTNQAA